ncbi:MAG: efflux RND transporter periplasmic adaptor subunit [Pseudomonadota bacterium]|nr:efflux RND transporter periplasmic adaptor subunit [Pseudomonadota bacterium]
MKRVTALLLSAVVLAVVLAAGGLVLDYRSGSTPYRTAAVHRGGLQSLITATGAVRPVVTTNVSTQVSGQVAEVLADFNDPVSKGQVLARLDSATFIARMHEAQAELDVARAELANREAALAKAQAQQQRTEARRGVEESEVAGARARAEEARRAHERHQALSLQGGVADSELEAAKTELAATQALLQAAQGRLLAQDAEIAATRAEVAMARASLDLGQATIRQREAALEEARVTLRRTEIRAPLDGVVIGRDVEQGQTVAASLQAPTLFTLAQDLARMQIETHVDEADIGRLRVGQNAFFTVDAYPGRRFAGRVTAIRKAPKLLHNVVTYSVLVDADNPDLALFPGMTAVMRVVVKEVRDVVRIPNAALRFVPSASPAAAEGGSDGEGRVRVWRPGPDGRPHPVWVLTGVSDEQYTVMLEGELGAGDRLIVGYEDAQ